ncbi:hypothetical protein BDY17DRAFT_320880 [Neohortaea acidophila]|uniref:EGF-like domain-containing protein n=1 Tax=Neohortaea acidophila TaxID=245834 RepID=A0A6A6Q0W5_9PEZI|nr:uncharacterized protein BDY17DRAFT_320880 [Neohortaea acidophila]KAF2486050.1 hypothetical protein BDY17DRAFT_320880 [Neohortaea acidophila]
MYPPQAPLDARYRPRPIPQQHAPPVLPQETNWPLENEGVTADSEPEHWPLPPRTLSPFPPRSNSPLGHPPRHPPPSQPRVDYQFSFSDRPRPPYRPGASGKPYPPPSPSQKMHPGNAQWAGDGYNAPSAPVYYHRPPQPRSPKKPAHGFSGPAPGTHYQQRPPRPPGQRSSRRGPADLPRLAVPAPLAERSPNPPTLTPASDHANERIPSYYFEKSDGSQEGESSTPPNEVDHNESPTLAQRTDENGGAKPVGFAQNIHENAEMKSARSDSVTPTPMIRQASLGKKTRPALTTITNGERRRESSSGDANTMHSSQPESSDGLTPFIEAHEPVPGAWVSEGPTPDDSAGQDRTLDHDNSVARDATGVAAVVGAAGAGAMVVDAAEADENDADARSNSPRRSSHLLGPVPGLQRQSFTASEAEILDIPAERRSPVLRAQDDDPPAPLSPLAHAYGDEQNDVHEYGAIGTITEGGPSDDTEGLTEKSEIRRSRPSFIEDDTAGGERGSMTSLPDLIRRATKLARNLDRGKTASRLGMNFFNTSESDVNVEKYRAAINTRQSKASMSDMLNVGGQNNEMRRSLGQFSSMLRHSQLPSDSDAAEVREKTKRKCCGMPLWLFLLLLALLVLLIAAAVVIPVVLFVIPKQHPATTAASKPTSGTLQGCSATQSCENGGVHIIARDNSCSCLCVNGYTGETCSVHEPSGCTTTAVSLSSQATIGSDLPQLIASSGADFNVPLNAETLLGLFSTADLNCAQENTLVTFQQDGATRRSAFTDTGSITDFAGVAVLYILQASGELNQAASAQHTLQYYLSSAGQQSGSAAQNISLGNGFSCNLEERKLAWTLSSGATVSNQ